VSYQRQLAAKLRQHDAINTASTDVPLVPVWVHVVRRGTKISQGNTPHTWIVAQINVLNTAYAGRIKFQLLGVTKTTNIGWFPLRTTGSAEWRMKQALRRGTMQTLNLYTTQLTGGLLGWATLPTDGSLAMDGVVVGFTTLPGSPTAPFNLGDTATHEVGHWHGLFHTFEGGCSASGDMVSDTPAVATPTYGCPRGRDSCSSLPGSDLVNNFMDYSDDSCMNSFTEGQFSRMQQSWIAFRANR